MTYVKQLEDYEEAVMAKRLAEMPPEELERLLTEVRLHFLTSLRKALSNRGCSCNILT